MAYRSGNKNDDWEHFLSGKHYSAQALLYELNSAATPDLSVSGQPVILPPPRRRQRIIVITNIGKV